MTLGDLETMFIDLENIIDFFEKDGSVAFEGDKPIGMAFKIDDIEGMKLVLKKHKDKLGNKINGIRRRDLIKI
jgi:hypothetical protein